MGNVVSLPDLQPAVRYDGVPWITAVISEGPAPEGPFVTIATVMLEPVDLDPSKPQARSITTSAAVLTAGWYPVTLEDAQGGQQFLAAVQYPPPAPAPELTYCSVDDVQARTSGRPITATSKPSIAQVQGFIEEAAAEINAILINNGYEVPIDPVQSPDAWATVHKANIDGASAMTEAAAPTSPTLKSAQAAWDAVRKMLGDSQLVLNAPQDLGRANPRGPWVTTQPSGRTFNPMFGRPGPNPHNTPRDPYFSRESRY